MKIVTIFLLLVSISSMAMVSTDKDKKELRKIYEQSKNEEKQKITLYAVGAGVSFFVHCWAYINRVTFSGRCTITRCNSCAP
jgi:hypothetical protein